MPRPTVPTSLPGRVFAVLLLWFVVVLAGWGLRPITDHIPVRCTDPGAAAEAAEAEGTAREGTAAEPTDASSDADSSRRPRHLREDDGDAECTEDDLSSVSASCHSPISGDGSLRGDAPTAEPGWELERSPCRTPVRSAAQLMTVNAGVFVAGTAGLAVWRNRRRTTAGVSTRD